MGVSYWMPSAWVGEKRQAGVRERVRVTVDGDGTISSVVAGEDPASQDIRLHGMAVPGAANCHSHTFHRALRGLGREGSTFWSWRETMYRVAAALTPENYYAYAKAVYQEMLLAGYTTVAEFHYVHHRPDGTAYDDPNAMGMALVRAAHDAGIRITLLDACYLHADPQGSPLSERQRRFGDGSARAWADRVTALDAQVRSDPGLAATALVGAAAHSVRACSPDEAGAVAEWTRNAPGIKGASGATGTGAADVAGESVPRPLHVHLSEQLAENKACEEATGLTPTALLDRAGFWGANAVAVHATHLNDADVAALGAAGGSVAICSTTEADLADGIPRAAELRDAGAHLCVGSDENVSIDPFEEVRRMDGNQRLVSHRRDVFTPAELMAAITSDGQRACGWTDAGALAVGRLADFIVLDPDSPRTAGARPDSIPLVASGADVTDVVVGGRRVVEGRRLTEGNQDPASRIADLTSRLRQEMTR